MLSSLQYQTLQAVLDIQAKLFYQPLHISQSYNNLVAFVEPQMTIFMGNSNYVSGSLWWYAQPLYTCDSVNVQD